jgi:hypothetical protein
MREDVKMNRIHSDTRVIRIDTGWAKGNGKKGAGGRKELKVRIRTVLVGSAR